MVKFRKRLAQAALLGALLYTIYGMFVLGYEVVLINAAAGIFIVFSGAITAAVLVWVIEVINSSIKGE